ncbi:trans-sulfuration enzyme family protein [Leptolyngbya iicbica]|uniref:homocysteine desulfhydrase n=2 Tax=Cyanophyceae TaxID=3028117 RepID=A0A4V2E2K5_9CYAN|nr:PLP-dependent aspartate aminotransferase family protein [Leptolyngbya sp. LK]RZM78876.1 PLP-dependent transferase [Leptolyngbya sp. LK]
MATNNSYVSQGMQTTAIHAGAEPDSATHASSPSIVMASSFVVKDATTPFSPENVEEQEAFFYTREGNPTVQRLEKKLAALENAEACAAFGSGMAAISALMFYLLKPDDHVIMSDVAYVGAAELMKGLVPSLGIKVTRVDTTDLTAVQNAVLPETKLIHIETPCNPIVRLTDIKSIVDIACAAGAKVSVDSTFATPVATRPIELGVDFVIHSLSKYLCGHGDAIGGAVIGSRNEISNLRDLVIHLGGVISPFNAWLIMRGITTLPIRMKAHEDNALKVARFLEEHPKVKRVIYPGLPSHPQYELAKQQMRNFSGMIAFQTSEPLSIAQAFAKHLKTIHYAVSLGHQCSLIYYVPTDEILQTSFALTEAQVNSYRSYAGDGIFRFSVGLEDAEDICKDLDLSIAKS